MSLFAPGELSAPGALFDLGPPAGDGGASRGLPRQRTAAGQAARPGAVTRPGADTRPGAGAAAAPLPADGEQSAAGPAGGRRGGLDPDQQAAVELPGPVMIIAGPGTGKTRVLTSRIARQVADLGVAPQACVALAFTRRAAGEMRARLAVLLPGQAAGVTVTTFHGLGLTILREHPGPAGLAAGFEVAAEPARIAAAAELTGSERAGRRLITAAATDPSARQDLAAALAARNVVDFDGLIELPAALLERDPALARELRNRWTHISVDEYQDIDHGQYRLLRLLAGDGRGLTVIGDPDQAIYGFRGADVRFFLEFGRDYPGARTQQLTRGYRSTQRIVSAAVQAIAPDTLVPGRALRAAAGDGPALVFHQAADEHAEAAWIARAIDRLLGGASFHSLDSGRAGPDGHDGLSLADIAVLYRTDAQAEPLGQALDRAGLPLRKGSHDRLGRRTAVPEIVCEMRLADPAAGPAAGQSAQPGGHLAAAGHAPAPSVADRLSLAVRRLAARAPAAGTAGPAPAAADYRTAGELLAPLARQCAADVDRFCTEIALGAEADALDPRADAITLLTLHAAKGLEFEVVFLAGCEQGLLPLRLAGSPPLTEDDRAQERRLLFVGMTRARARLLLTCASRRTRWGAIRTAGPSAFLAAVDSGLLTGTEPERPRRPALRQLRLL